MSRRPYKTTGCFRFFILIIILAPVAYLVASYVNGEDGISNIKRLLHLDGKEITVSTSDAAGTDNADILKEQVRIKDARIEELMKENDKLKKDIQDMQALLNKLNNLQDSGNQ